MEREEWMNDQVRREIEDLQRDHGFEEREALAYWHLAEARRLVIRMTIADEARRRKSLEEEYDAGLGQQIADAVTYAAGAETRISQHFSALYRELGLRVLRRDYPEGWTDTRI